MLFKRNTSTRRLDPRRKGPTEAPLYTRMLAREGAWNLWLLLGGFLLCVLLLDVWNSDSPQRHRNQYLPHDIHARVDVKLLDKDSLRAAALDAKYSTAATYKINTSLLDGITATLTNAPAQFKAAKSLETLDAELAQKLQLTPLPGWVKALREQILQRDQLRKEAAELAEKARLLKPETETDTVLKAKAAELIAKAKTLTAQGDKLAATIAPEQTRLDTFDADRKAIAAEWSAQTETKARANHDETLQNLRAELQTCFFVLAEELSRQQPRNVSINNGQDKPYTQNINTLVGLSDTANLRRRVKDVVEAAKFPKPIRSGITAYLSEKLLQTPLYLY
ncbi:MAG: hypothetical protein HN909_09290, partial [Phycisphaerales bacterium]|nr:hypothetical protein [Phycisphaerales bacterium]